MEEQDLDRISEISLKTFNMHFTTSCLHAVTDLGATQISLKTAYVDVFIGKT